MNNPGGINDRSVVADIISKTIISMAEDDRRKQIPDLVNRILRDDLAGDYGAMLRTLVPFTRNAGPCRTTVF